ncbi:MAG: hypothetical protein K6A14_07320 [Erysipelotrichaceae bacterium]|nr:hypothetical protein [Erysipelotrichaceae bacterium]
MKKILLAIMALLMTLSASGCAQQRVVIEQQERVFYAAVYNYTDKDLREVRITVRYASGKTEEIAIPAEDDRIFKDGEHIGISFSLPSDESDDHVILAVELTDEEGNVFECESRMLFVFNEYQNNELWLESNDAEGYRIRANFRFSNTNSEVIPQGQTIGMEVFRKLIKSDKNICFSPLSLEIALKMLYEGAKGATLKQFTDLQTGPLNIITQKAAIANSIWADDEFEVNDDYLKALLEKYQAEVFNTDLTGDTFKKINEWISRKTNELIREVFNEPLSDSMVMVLINALYFKANWRDELHRLEPDDFTTSSGQKVKTEYVGNIGYYLTFNEGDFSGMIIEYDDGSYFIAVKAPENGAVPEYETLMRFYEKADYERLNFKMPVLDIQYEEMLNDALKEIGLTYIFDADEADLSGLSKSGKDKLDVSMVLQKCHLKLDEYGTEAAAVTVIGVEKTSYITEEPRPLYFDSPYYFAIVNNNAVMFAGYVNNPTSAN